MGDHSLNPATHTQCRQSEASNKLSMALKRFGDFFPVKQGGIFSNSSESASATKASLVTVNKRRHTGQ